MLEEANKSIVRRIWKEAWQESNFAAIDELVAIDYVLHAYPEDLAFGSGAEGLKRLITSWWTSFPDSQMTIETLIAERDQVVTRYTAKPTPATVTTGIWIDHIVDGKVLESWVDWDRLGLFQQLGIIPKPE